MIQTAKTNLFTLLSHLADKPDESVKKFSWSFIIPSLVLVASLWSSHSEQSTLFVLSLIGYLVSALSGIFLYVYLALDLSRFVTQEDEYDVWVLGDSLYAQDEETQSTQEGRWIWSEGIKALLLLLQMVSFLLSTILLIFYLVIT